MLALALVGDASLPVPCGNQTGRDQRHVAQASGGTASYD